VKIVVLALYWRTAEIQLTLVLLVTLLFLVVRKAYVLTKQAGIRVTFYLALRQSCDFLVKQCWV